MKFASYIVVSIMVHIIILVGVSYIMPPSRSLIDTNETFEITEISFTDLNTQTTATVKAPIKDNTNSKIIAAEKVQQIQSKLANDFKPQLTNVTNNEEQLKKDNNESELQEIDELNDSSNKQLNRLERDIKQTNETGQTVGTVSATPNVENNPIQTNVPNSNTVKQVGNQEVLWLKPPVLIYNPPLKYPLIAKRQNWEGKVTLQVLLSSRGKIINAIIKQSSGYKILDEAALKIVLQRRYQPALKNEQPIDYTFIIDFHWRLKDATD